MTIHALVSQCTLSVLSYSKCKIAKIFQGFTPGPYRVPKSLTETECCHNLPQDIAQVSSKVPTLPLSPLLDLTTPGIKGLLILFGCFLYFPDENEWFSQISYAIIKIMKIFLVFYFDCF